MADVAVGTKQSAKEEAAARSRVLAKMLDRLFASLVSGPSLNCRPHSSRQRVDWTQIAKFQDLTPEAALAGLLGADEQVKLVGRAPLPRGVARDARPGKPAADGDGDSRVTPEQRAARQAWADQANLLGKLRTIAEDARTYEQDTGVHVLNIGFPLLSLPPAVTG
ncbi:MAG TPA: DUF4011 domain-containing protein, partial [Tepidisphaeraceae bacterium]|nr:DUF4011 domain-containing protein [Tepidisphaeraceae bacterium]